ncbi:MAG: hypothetical protein AAFO69_13300, partial [Bacteroidota bacterium]
MFEDLKEEDILLTLEHLSNTNDHGSSQYKVWYEGQEFSPAYVISKAFELKGKPVDRSSFTTDTAQGRLLELGFPITDPSRDDGFFTPKDLLSLSKLVQRKYYNKHNTVDKSLGHYLRDIPWQKTKDWARKLGELGWRVEGGKQWQKRMGRKGSGFKDYTWFRIYPVNAVNDKICFTVGIHGEPDVSLVYKLHNQFTDEFFWSEGRQDIFDNYLRDHGIAWQHVWPHELINMSWDDLVQRAHQFFTSNLDHFETISNQF